MSTQFAGTVDIQDAGGSLVRITLNGDNASITAGGAGQDGAITLTDGNGGVRVVLGPKLVGKQPNQSWEWTISIFDATGNEVIGLGPEAEMRLGSHGTAGDLLVYDRHGTLRARIAGSHARLDLRDDQSVDRITLDPLDGVNVAQSGSNRAGFFKIDNAKNTRPVLEADHAGSGDGIAGHTAGALKSGVYGAGTALDGYGVSGRNTNYDCLGALGARPVLNDLLVATGVFGWAGASDLSAADGATAVVGLGEGNSAGIYGWSENGDGVGAESAHGTGLWAWCADSVTNPEDPNVWAGYLDGNVYVVGNFFAGAKYCKVDHPLDPTNKYLVHSCVESSERLNVYCGTAVLDRNGEAWIDLPAWFEAHNTSFQYQLTPVGAPAPDLHVAQEIDQNRFKVAGGAQGMRISWQITGIRNDAYARAHPLRVEVEKADSDRGKYLHPVEHGAPQEARISHRRARRM
jgi:hypothetical protein